MAVHQPLKKRTQLSKNELTFWMSPWGDSKETRATALIRQACLPREGANADEAIINKYLQSEKLHDREPKMIRDALLKMCPDFFDSFPGKNSEIHQKAGIGRAMKCVLRGGESLYGKPALRGENEEPAVSAVPAQIGA